MTDPAKPPLHRFAHEAMATTFEVVAAGVEENYARQASKAAFEELDRLHLELNRFDPTSDVSQINNLKVGEKVRVGLATMACLKAAAQVSADTGGAFDVTVGSLLACWRDKDKSPRTPTDAELAEARARTGMNLLELLEDEHAVRVKVGGVKVDLGGVGKGYAVDRIMDILRQWGLKQALVHGGSSSVLALGAPPPAPAVGDERGWKLAVAGDSGNTAVMGYVYLKDRSLSGSAMPAKDPHIIDPRSGRPAVSHAGTWVLAGTATLTDCLSTALIVMTPAEIEAYGKRHPDVGGRVLPRQPADAKPVCFGKWEASFEPRAGGPK
jgi:FAD:protein FMN transferase